jgi:hypothetical protein
VNGIDLSDLTFADIDRLNRRLLDGLCQHCDYRFTDPQAGSFWARCGRARQYYGWRWLCSVLLGICRGCGLFVGEWRRRHACPRCGLGSC